MSYLNPFKPYNHQGEASSLQEPSPLQRPSTQQREEATNMSDNEFTMSTPNNNDNNNTTDYQTRQPYHSKQAPSSTGSFLNASAISTPGQPLRSIDGKWSFLNSNSSRKGFPYSGVSSGGRQQVPPPPEHQYGPPVYPPPPSGYSPPVHFHPLAPQQHQHQYHSVQTLQHYEHSRHQLYPPRPMYHHHHMHHAGGVPPPEYGDYYSALPPGNMVAPPYHHQHAVPAAPLHPTYSYNEDSPRSPSPPHVPPSFTSKLEQSANEKEEETMPTSAASAAPLQESQSNNTTAATNSSSSSGTANQKPSAPKPPVPVHDASLLLGLRDTSNTTTASTPKTASDNEENNHTKPANARQQPSNTAKPPSTKMIYPPRQHSHHTKLIPRQNFPNRLALPSDRANLNSLHCFIRSQLLEVFVVKGDPTKNSMVGRVGMQCVFCSQNRPNDPRREKEATMAVFYPRSVNEIYRLVTNWTRCHVGKCTNIPPPVRREWDNLKRVDKTRGKTQYWSVSAAELGLVNCTQTKAGGIRYSDTEVVPDQES